MNALAGIFLVAHGLLHLAIWLTPPKDDAPFDPRRSWLLGERPGIARALAVAAAAVLVVAGVLVLSGSGAGAVLAAAGAGVSLGLVVLTFHPWFTAAVAIDVAIIVAAAA